MEEKIIIPIKTDDNKQLQVQLAGISYCDGSYEIKRDISHSTYVFEYIDKGKGYLKVEDKEYYPHEGDIYIVPANTDHTYRSSAKDPWIKYWFNVNGTLISSLLETYSLKGIHYFTKCQRIKPLFQEIIATLEKNPSADISINIHKIIIEINKNHIRNLPSINNISTESATIKSYIDSNVKKTVISLDELSALINKSKPQLIRIFKKDMQISPYQYFLQQKMFYSCKLLTHSRKSIKEIAYLMGFTDEFYFSNLFKKKKGVSPSVYRKNRVN
jgi:AraC-like DNA-binding protein